MEFERNKDGYLSKNFKYTEVQCKCGKCQLQTIDFDIIKYAQLIRDYFNKPVVINSGFRCYPHNKVVGGAMHSQHRYGKALDIKVKDTPPARVAKFAELIGIKGIGLYSWGCHIDTRKNKSYWKDKAQTKVNTFGGSVPFNNTAKLLKYGDNKESVKALQWSLNVFYNNMLVVDGIFGKKTLQAVKEFQRFWNIKVDGVAGKETLKRLLG